jgi:hypothetical protein
MITKVDHPLKRPSLFQIQGELSHGLLRHACTLRSHGDACSFKVEIGKQLTLETGRLSQSRAQVCASCTGRRCL